MSYKAVPIPTLVPQKRQRSNRTVVPVVHPGVVRKPIGWQRHRPVVQLVPPLAVTQPPVTIRKVAP